MERNRITHDAGADAAFRHEALLYAGEDDFVEKISSFVADGVAAGEPVLVVVDARKIERLREALNGASDAVCFADMADVGANPARIIPAWQDFVRRHAAEGRRLRGVGEPIWAGRSADELVECQRHEALLNLAFADSGDWWLVCPYDTETLDAAVLDEAARTHPFVSEDGCGRTSADYGGLDAIAAPFDAPLPEPGGRPHELAFDAATLGRVRRFVAEHAAGAGLGELRTSELVLAAHEVAANSLRHGGGEGVLRIWQERDALICEVRDRGQILQPLVGRERPTENQVGGRGVWLVNQLCDLVQVRSSAGGTVVRMHMRRG